MSRTVFLETSIQIQRVLASPAQKIQIERELDASSVHAVTSNYVWMEYQRTIVADYAHVHHVMGDYTDWGALFEHILDGPRAFRPRSAVRCTRIIGQIYRTSNQTYKLARQILSTQINRELRQMFWTNVKAIHDSVGCDLVISGTSRKQDGNYQVASRCRKDTATCSLPNFLSENQTRLSAIAEYLAAHPKCIKQQSRVEQHLAKVLDDPQAVLGQSTCWPLGDIIIALQVPDDAMLWTLDADFTPLAAALGLQLYNPTSAATPANTQTDPALD